MKYAYVLFDLDGTLTNPAAGICASIRYALEQGGYPAEPMEAYLPWIGPPLLDSFIRYLGVDGAEAQRLLQLYRQRFSTVGLFENALIDGIPTLLRRLRDNGIRMAVATGKPTVYAEQILEHFGIRSFFDMVSGIELSGEGTTKAEVIANALANWGLTDTRRCVMVGDRCHDVEGAEAHGMDCVYVLYGYGSREEAEGWGATQIAENAAELEQILLPSLPPNGSLFRE